MPLAWNLDPVERVVRMRHIEPVGFAEWRDALNASLPELAGDVSIGLLVDRRAALPPETAFAQSIASHLASHRNIFAGRRIAILVIKAGDACYGMARMQSTLNEKSGAVTAVFTSEVEALEWLTTSEPSATPEH
jgi:hypothetical protein